MTISKAKWIRDFSSSTINMDLIRARVCLPFLDRFSKQTLLTSYVKMVRGSLLLPSKGECCVPGACAHVLQHERTETPVVGESTLQLE